MGKKLWEILEENKEANDQEIERIRKKASEDFERASNQQSIWDKVNYIKDNFNIGMYKGTTGIAQGLMTDSANQMQKSKNKNTFDLFNNFVNAYSGNDLHNIAKSTANTINQGIDIINDKDKTIWQKVVDLNLNTISNGAKALTPGYGIYTATNELLGKYTDTDKQLLELNDKIQKPIDAEQERLAKEGEKQDGVTNFLANSAGVIGNMVPSITASAITKNPNIGLASMGLSVKGQATQEALDKGMDIDKATQIGDAKALIEVATEKLSGGAKIFGKGSLDDIAEDLVKKGAKSKFGRFLLTQVANTGGEILEEEISDVLGNAIDKGTTDPDRKIFDLKQSLETAGSTAFTTTMLNLLTGGMINDYKQISQDMNQYRDVKTGEVLNDNSQNALNQAEDIINQNRTPNLPQNQTQNEPNLPTQQTMQEQNNVAQNGNMEQILPTQNIPTQNKVVVTNKDNLISSAKKYNLNYKDLSIENSQKALEKRGIKARFDDSYFNNESEGGKYILTTDDNGNVTREIIINPKADEKTIIQEMAIHELTHDIIAGKTDKSVKMYNEIKDFLYKDKDFPNRLTQLEEAYLNIRDENGNPVYNRNDTNFNKMIEEEAIAKTLQTKFGTQEEVNRLVNYTPSKARMVYDWIVDKLNKITGGRIEKLYWEDVKNKFERAFSEEGNYKNAGNIERHYFNNIANFDEIEYNNAENKRISSSKTWKSIKDTVDSAVKNEEIYPGVNEIELYDYGDKKYKKYTIYYKDIDNWKIVDEEDARDYYGGNYESNKFAKNTDEGNGRARSRENNYKWDNEQIKNRKETADDVRLPVRDQEYSDTNRKDNIEVNRNKKYEGLEKSSSFNLPENVKDIKNMNEFLRKAVENETNHEWKERLKDAKSSNYTRIDNRRTPLQYKREIVQQYLDYKKPAKDNKGRILSPQQKEYFKDSVVRNAKGELLEVYHGTPNPGFTEFKRNVNYFTDNQNVANTYTGNNGVYKGYIDIQNPIRIDANKEVWSKIDIDNIKIDNIENIKEFLEKHGSSTWKEQGKIRTSTADIVSAIEDAIDEGTIDADGIIIENIYDEGTYGSSVGKQLGTDYITFNSNQFKNTDNTKPTTNKDIRYSVSTDGSMKDNKTGKKVVLDAETGSSDKTLLAIHNLDEAKLKGVLELGGFPVPSIAITNPNIVNHEQFGDISVIFNKETINPANKANEVYDRDVWSPTFPQVDYEINTEVSDKIANDIGIEWWRLNDYAEDSRNPEDLVNKILRRDEIIEKYINDNKLKYDTKYREADINKWYNKEKSIKKFIKDNDITIEKIRDNKSLRYRYFEELRNEFNKDSDEIEAIERQIDIMDHFLDDNTLDRLSNLAKDFNLLTNGDTKIIDDYETNKEKLKVAKENGIESYLKEQVQPMFGEKGIRNNLDPFTSSGRRRSFWSLHDEYNIDNIIKAMTNQDTISSQNSFMTGFGKINAQMSQKFNSISDIKENESRIVSDVNNEEIEHYRDIIGDDISDLAEYYKHASDDSFGMQGFTNASESVFDLAKSGNLTEENFRKILEENIMNSKRVPTKLINRVIDNLNSLKDLKTDYFEAKPQRAVGFDEIDAIVIPSDLSNEVKQQLKDRGIKTIEYDRNNENERTDILKSLNEYKFSKTSESFDEYLTRRIGKEGTRTPLKDLKLPVKEKQEVKVPIKKEKTQQRQENTNRTENLPTKGETVNWNEIERPEGKIRKHYKSIIESSNTTAEAKKIARELMGSDTYVPESNKSQIQRADKFIEKYGVEKALDRLMTNVDNNTVTFDGVFRKVGVDDIALGERLIQYYSKTGDASNLQNAILATAQAGTDAGRAVQLLSIINHQTPTGQVTWVQRSVDKMNQELVNKRGENAPQFEFTPEMMQKILETDNQESMYKAIDEVYEELGQQVSKSKLQQIDSWRYFSMLANPKTHIRNIVGNVAMGNLQSVKNKVAGAIEGTVAQFNPNMERTHTLKRASKEVREFAKNDIKNIADSLGLNQDKYNPKSRLENSMRTFKSDAMEKTLGKAFELNEKALEVEDAWGLKSGYVKALSEYITANKLNPQTITDAQLAKARNYAIAEAKEATFHAENAIATAINQFSKKGKSAKFLTDAVLPFVKTPMNVAKAGMEYNPTGLIKTLTYDTVQLRKGNISVNKYIDNLSKGLTGTGVAVLGYALAEAGILKASGGEDDKKEKFDEALGRQAYSLEINGKTYSLDWLAPAGIPLFVGAEAHNINKAGENEKTSKSNDDDKRYKQITESLENWANAMTNSMSPMAEMSMISGLTSALKSYDQDSTKMLGTMGTNAVKSYVNQFVPTALGQVVKTADDYERSTTSTAKGILPKAIDQTKLQLMSKIPGLRKQLPVKTDVWGKEQKQEGNIAEKALKNAILPFTIKSVNNSPVDKELNELYNKTGASSILPTTSLEKTFTIDKQTYRMTNEEYNKYKKDYGRNSYKLLDGLVSSSGYKNLTNEQKQKAIESIYSYTKEKNKVDYAKNNKLKVEPSTLYNTMEDLKSKGGNQGSYLHYIAKTTGMEKESERNKVLAEANYSAKTKSIIYSNGTGKDDKFYNIVANNTNLDITEYLNYKIQKNAKAFEADKDKNGKAISGSAKEKLYNYVNNNISNYESRLMILGYNYKLSNKERRDLTDFINKKSKNEEEAIESFKKLTKNYEYKNGKIYYK